MLWLVLSSKQFVNEEFWALELHDRGRGTVHPLPTTQVAFRVLPSFLTTNNGLIRLRIWKQRMFVKEKIFSVTHGAVNKAMRVRFVQHCGFCAEPQTRSSWMSDIYSSHFVTSM